MRGPTDRQLRLLQTFEVEDRIRGRIIRSATSSVAPIERQWCEQADLNLLFRWFLDRQPSDETFDASTFPKNRERLETHGLAKECLGWMNRWPGWEEAGSWGGGDCSSY